MVFKTQVLALSFHFEVRADSGKVFASRIFVLIWLSCRFRNFLCNDSAQRWDADPAAQLNRYLLKVIMRGLRRVLPLCRFWNCYSHSLLLPSAHSTVCFIAIFCCFELPYCLHQCGCFVTQNMALVLLLLFRAACCSSLTFHICFSRNSGSAATG